MSEPGNLATARRPPLSPGAQRVLRIAINLAGAVVAALFARSSLEFYLHTHRLIGVVFVAEQLAFAVAFLIRRPPRAVSQRLSSWLLAAGGTFGGLLLRPAGAHPQWGVDLGLTFQILGVLMVLTAMAALNRSFGFVAADRGLKTHGAYAVVRHPIYASYLLIQGGYVLQSLSVRNALVYACAMSFNIGRALAEERLLTESSGYQAYRQLVRWRIIPFLW